MTAIKIDRFFGEAPRVVPHHLDPRQAQKAENCNLLHGDLRPWHGAQSVGQLPTSGIKTLYRYAGRFWWTFTNPTRIVRAPVAGDTTERTYYADGISPPQATDSAIATGPGIMPAASYNLGIPYPQLKPTLSYDKNSDASKNDTRSYVYTFVSAWGEEGPPSPPSNSVDVDVDVFGKPQWGANVAVKKGDRRRPTVANGFVYECTVAGTTGATEPTWPTISGQTIIDGNVTWKAVSQSVGITNMDISVAGAYNIVSKRIYRTNTSGGVSEFQFVAEIPLAQVSYNDSIQSQNLGEVLPSADYDPPPSNLAGLVSMPNGIIAGFSGNEICFSEPYQPHAWPVKYRQSLKLPPGGEIVGLGVYGNTLVVLTTGEPYVLTGSHPSMMSMDKLEIAQPCVSQRSIVDMGYGVAYASPDGLMVISPSGPQLFTEQLFTREDWQTFNPSSIHAYFLDGRYIAFYDTTPATWSGTLSVHMGMRVYPTVPNNLRYRALTSGLTGTVEPTWPTVAGQTVVDGEVTWIAETDVTPVKGGFILDPRNPEAGLTRINAYYDAGYVDLQSDVLYLADSTVGQAGLWIWNYASTDMTYTWRSKKFQAAKPTNFSCAQVIAETYPVTVNIYADGVLKHTQSVVSSDLFRLPGGFLATDWEIEIVGTSRVRAVYMTESVDELRAA
ncbi:hypothetical protein D6779_10105 [Candidatus Parcubacteria bacterium]|nr:MAG: hypothetical protein D6779_10105 [Candidatus Parcubacteria bacterium]